MESRRNGPQLSSRHDDDDDDDQEEILRHRDPSSFRLVPWSWSHNIHSFGNFLHD